MFDNYFEPIRGGFEICTWDSEQKVLFPVAGLLFVIMYAWVVGHSPIWRLSASYTE